MWVFKLKFPGRIKGHLSGLNLWVAACGFSDVPLRVAGDMSCVGVDM